MFVAALVLLAVPGPATAAPGDILVADQQAFEGAGAVIRVNPATGLRTTVSANHAPAGEPGFVNPMDVVVDDGGEILVVDRDAFSLHGGGVIRVDPVSGQRTAVIGPSLIRVEPHSGERTTVASNGNPPSAPFFATPAGIAIEPTCMYVRITATVFGKRVKVCA